MYFKKLFGLVIFLLFIALLLNVTCFAKDNPYPFDVKISGNGEKSIIFIPGFACSGDVWNDTKINFENSYKCYTLTMSGFAGAAPQPDPTFRKWEEGIVSYIIDNNIDKPVIIGHSMGGGLALAIAADYPELISKIVVVDALPCLAALMDPNFKSVENPDCSNMLSQMKSVSDEDFYKRQKSTMPMLLADTSMTETVVNWSVISDRTTFAKMYCDFSNTDLRQNISSVKCPALILLESYFTNMKPVITEQYKNLKTADLRYSTKGLHFIMFDDNEWYDEQLKSFLN
ncbi:MAG: alpha/beta hydrolase [Bacteroidetes bacterium]|nr:alpha/beta hydrolase [Bacteroidota bacterium]